MFVNLFRLKKKTPPGWTMGFILGQLEPRPPHCGRHLTLPMIDIATAHSLNCPITGPSTYKHKKVGSLRNIMAEVSKPLLQFDTTATCFYPSFVPNCIEESNYY